MGWLGWVGWLGEVGDKQGFHLNGLVHLSSILLCSVGGWNLGGGIPANETSLTIRLKQITSHCFIICNLYTL